MKNKNDSQIIIKTLIVIIGILGVLLIACYTFNEYNKTQQENIRLLELINKTNQSCSSKCSEFNYSWHILELHMQDNKYSCLCKDDDKPNRFIVNNVDNFTTISS